MKNAALMCVLGLSLAAFGCGDDDGGNGGSGGGGGSAGGGGAGGGGGECMADLCVEAGSGSTTWEANTTPPGGGFPPDVTGGCEVFVTSLMTTIALEVSITLDVVSDGNNGLTTAWSIVVTNPVLAGLGMAAELGALDINAAVSDADGGPINSGLTAEAEGATIGTFYETPAGPLVLATDGMNPAITAGSATLTPTAGLGSTVGVNWNGEFVLDLTLMGNPLITVDESVCTFDTPGSPVEFLVVE